MQVLELHFNPKFAHKKHRTVFDTFCFMPSTRPEVKLGSLYLLGEFKNFLPNNKALLNDLAEIIKNEYYKTPERTAEDCLRAGLQKANEFLGEKLAKNDTAWLGNLNFAALVLTPDFLINLAMLGNLKILLFREGDVFELGKDITSPVRVFSNIVVGKMSQGDKILFLTQGVFDVFEKEGILQGFSGVKERKAIKKLLKEKKKILRGIFGACLIIFIRKEKKKIFLPVLKKTPTRPPLLQTKLKKNLIALLILAVLLALGYLLF